MNLETVSTHFKNLSLDDYELDFGDRIHLGYQKNTDDKIVRIGFLNLSTMTSNGISFHIVFRNYDKLSKSSIHQNDLDFNPPSVRPFAFNKYFENQPITYKQQIFPLKLESAESLKTLTQILSNSYSNEIKSFDEYWKDIRSFLPFIEVDSKKSAILLGNNYILKKMTIWKLCKHPSYEVYVKNKLNALQVALENDPSRNDYTSMSNEIIRKHKQLGNIKTKFEWNENLLAPKEFNGELPSFN